MTRRASIHPSPAPAAICWEASRRFRSANPAETDEEIEVWRDLLDRDPESVAAMRALEELYELTGRTEDYLDLVEHRLDRTGSDEERLELYQRMAAVWEDFRRPERVRRCLEKWLALDATSEEAYVSLEHLLLEQGQFQDLATLLQRHVHVVEPARRIELLGALAAVLDQQLGDASGAEEAYREILRAEPENAEALTALARLLEANERWDETITVLQSLAACLEDPGARAEAHYRIGTIHGERRHDADSARDHLEQALTLNQGHCAAALALAALHRERHEWHEAAEMLVRAAGSGVIERTQTALLLEAATIHERELHEPERATELYERLLAIDPEHVPAAERLTAMLFPTERFPELEPVLDMLARKKAEASPADRATTCFCAATVAERLGKDEKAAKYYRQALEAAPLWLPALQAYAELCSRTCQQPEALNLYEVILRHHGSELVAPARADVLFRLGTLRVLQGERESAVAAFAQAVGADPHHRGAIQALIDLYTAANRWDGVVTAHRALAAIAGPEEQAAIFATVGDIYREKLRDAKNAIDAYLEALERRPEDRGVRQHLLALYTTTRRWAEAAATLCRIAELETDPELRSRYLYAAALLHRDKLKNLPAALKLCNQALDCNPDLLVAFQAIDRVCTQAKNWPALEAQYLRMITRVADAKSGSGSPDRHAIAATLWDNLGEIYRSRLRDYVRAAAAYEHALALRRDDPRLLTILGELYAALGPSQAPRAARAQHALIHQSPGDPTAYRALRHVYMQAGAYDRAYCVCAALVTLRAADESERGIVKRFRPEQLERTPQRLTNELWTSHVRCPTQDPRLGTIFAAMHEAVALPHAHALADFDRRRGRSRRGSADGDFASIVEHVSQVLGTPTPRIIENPNLPTAVAVANCQEQGVLVPTLFTRSDLLSTFTDMQLAFVAARQLNMLRPEHFIVLVVPTVAELRTLYLAALEVAGVSLGDADRVPLVVSYADGLRTALTPDRLRQLRRAAQDAAAESAGAQVERWMHTIELTGHRAGLVACNDLMTAAGMLLKNSAVTAEMLHALCGFAASEEYFALREHLRVAVRAVAA
jgi:golgin subfamily B member 1